jgi:hypothetical protein
MPFFGIGGLENAILCIRGQILAIFCIGRGQILNIFLPDLWLFCTRGQILAIFVGGAKQKYMLYRGSQKSNFVVKGVF